MIAFILGLVGVTVIGLLLWKIPEWQVNEPSLAADKRIELQDKARSTLAQIFGGIAILAGAYLTFLNWDTTKEAQITDRFNGAITQLGATHADGKPNIEIRLGGIYALQRIANDPKTHLHWPIMEILTAYVRKNAPWEPKPLSCQSIDEKPEILSIRAPDIQAILNVLGERPRTLSGSEPRDLNLRRTDLRAARFYRADLEDVHFDEANLSWSSFHDPSGLKHAGLEHAILRRVKFRHTIMENADLRDADLYCADLSGTDLAHSEHLTQEQVDQALTDAKTKLPEGLKPGRATKQTASGPAAR